MKAYAAATAIFFTQLNPGLANAMHLQIVEAPATTCGPSAFGAAWSSCASDGYVDYVGYYYHVPRYYGGYYGPSGGGGYYGGYFRGGGGYYGGGGWGGGWRR